MRITHQELQTSHQLTWRLRLT